MAEGSWFRGGVIAAGIVLVCAIGGLALLGSTPDWQPTPPAPPPPQPATPPPAPTFDVVRVDPSGNTVIAGHAAPGAEVTIKDGDTMLGMVTADPQGAFAFVPASKLPPGAQQLSLSETLPGGQAVAGQVSASVNVPGTPSTPALTVLSGPDGSKVISGQGPKPGTLGIGTVDYDANGHAIFQGTAAAGEQVTLSLSGAKLGDAVAGKNGRWTFAATVPKNSGMLTLSSKSGQTTTAPFALETLPDAVAAGHIIIAPGQSLWLIARHVYGHGNMYTLIYKANAGKIKDPNLIFPGQAFSLPKPQS